MSRRLRTAWSVHFARGDARLDAAGKTLIDKLIATLNACPDVGLRIAGHARRERQRPTQSGAIPATVRAGSPAT
ncbi:MAG: hypothetical protein WDN31_04765 [Hyphomicrobium sp.]